MRGIGLQFACRVACWGMFCAGVVAVCAPDAAAQGDYPRVISPTGQPYGPTQAHYQYLKRYGVPYKGYTGLDIANGYPAPATGSFNFNVGGFGPYGGYADCYPYGCPYGVPYGGYGYGYGGYYGGPPAIIGGPIVVSPFGGPQYGYYGPSVIQPYPFPEPRLPTGTFSPLMEDSLRQERERWEAPLVGVQPAPAAAKLVETSTPQAKERSVRFEGQGDREIAGLKFTAATASYTQAVQVARDRSEPRFKLALTLASRREYVQAAQELKMALALDPTWPASGKRLDDFYTAANYPVKIQIRSRILDWAKDDVRDPDRLFLMGAFLHMDGDARGITLLETAARLAGQQPHLMAFLAPEAVATVGAVADGQPGQVTPIPTTEPAAEPVAPSLELPDLPVLPAPNADDVPPPSAEPSGDAPELK